MGKNTASRHSHPLTGPSQCNGDSGKSMPPAPMRGRNPRDARPAPILIPWYAGMDDCHERLAFSENEVRLAQSLQPRECL